MVPKVIFFAVSPSKEPLWGRSADYSKNRYWRIRNRNEHPAIAGGSASVVYPSFGFKGVTTALQRHLYLMRPLSSPFGNLWFFSWYALFLAACIGFFSQLALPILGGFWITSVLVLYLLVKRRLKITGLLALCTAWPGYLAALPALMVYTKFFH
jgi:hypothetical protein